MRTIVGLLIGAVALLAGVAWAALGAAQTDRQGVRIQYATVETTATSGGVQGSAFLLLSSRDILVARAAAGAGAACDTYSRVQATARLARGDVRSVTLDFTAARTGRLSITDPLGCGRTALSMELTDGSVVTATRGELSLTAIERRVGGRIAGTFSVAGVHGGAPLTIRGAFVLRVPRPATSGPPLGGAHS